MAKKPQNLLKTVGERVADAAEAVFNGPPIAPEGTFDNETGQLMPPADFDPSKAGIRDPFLADWDPLKKRGLIVNPSAEQRTIGLSEWIAGGIGEARQTLPGYLAGKQLGMAKRAVRSLAQPFQRKFK